METNATDILVRMLEQHLQDDRERFAAMDKKLDKVLTVTESLAESRTLAKGAWKATAFIAGGVASFISGVVGVVVWLLRAH